MQKTGSCLCRAVTYTLADAPTETGACHCGMCRKWTGGVSLAIEAAPDAVTFEGEDNLACYPSSDWGERCFCKTCGSSLYYRVTAPGPHHGMRFIGLGTLDDPSGITLTGEIFIDNKPEGYSFAEKTKTMTSAAFFAMFAPPE